MTLTEYAAAINELLAENPAAGTLPVIYASDDEGNDAHAVTMLPSVCREGDFSYAGIDYKAVMIN